MLHNFLEKQPNRAAEGGTDPAPRPGDYDLGSLESRAAARALLDAKSAGEEPKRLRVTVHTIGKPVNVEASTCMGYQCEDSRDPGKSLVVEMVQLDGADPSEMQLEQLKHWIGRVPIDGQTYKFAEVDAG